VRTTGRWTIAGIVTTIAFAAPVWVCGAFLLPPVIKDGVARWAIATAAGLALAALAALWGHGYASAESDEKMKAAGTGDVNNTIIDATVQGPVVQGRDFSGPITLGDDTSRGLPP
jgi:uncharacterized membrane protein